MQVILSFFKGRIYWLAMALCALMTEVVALYYQYVLGDYPCVICIHIRIWVAAFFLLGLVGFFLHRCKVGTVVAHVLGFIFAVGLLERSYVLYGTEKGLIDGSCSIALGFPVWFAVDEWVPWLFQVQGACGFTPDLWLGISMAEGLLATSIIAVFITAITLVLNIKRSA